jgi:hypothetical protein
MQTLAVVTKQGIPIAVAAKRNPPIGPNSQFAQGATVRRF